MAWFFICKPESDFDMFHSYALDNFNNNIVEADSLEDALADFLDGSVESREDVFVIEVKQSHATYIPSYLFEAEKKQQAEAERAAKFKQLEQLKKELGITDDSKKTLVEIWEHDRFSGPKLDETKPFYSKEEAVAFVKEYNSKNTEEKAPDYYTIARLK